MHMFRGLLGLNGFGGVTVSMHFAVQPITIAALVVGGLIGLWKWPRLRLSSSLKPVAAVADYAMVFAVMLLSVLWIGGGLPAPFLYYRF